MKASALIRDLANVIAFQGDVELEFVPDVRGLPFTHYELVPEYNDKKKTTGKVFVEIF